MKMQKIKCEGSKKEPRCYVHNDFPIGLTAVCPVCVRSFKAVAPLLTNYVMPHHKKIVTA